MAKGYFVTTFSEFESSQPSHPVQSSPPLTGVGVRGHYRDNPESSCESSSDPAPDDEC
jgi:hypothetical protein